MKKSRSSKWPSSIYILVAAIVILANLLILIIADIGVSYIAGQSSDLVKGAVQLCIVVAIVGIVEGILAKARSKKSPYLTATTDQNRGVENNPSLGGAAFFLWLPLVIVLPLILYYLVSKFINVESAKTPFDIIVIAYIGMRMFDILKRTNPEGTILK